MRADAAGLAFISREEGLVLHPYNDSVNNATIGVGHLLHLGPVTPADRARYAHFTRQQALGMLAQDVAKVEAVINRDVHVPVNQNMVNALCSLGFNIGTGGLASSTVLRELNAKHYQRAARAFRMWRNPPELLPRREREEALFLKPMPPNHDPAQDVLTAAEWTLVLAFRARRTNMTQQALIQARKRIWRAARSDPHGAAAGWAKLHRKARYELLRREAFS